MKTFGKIDGKIEIPSLDWLLARLDSNAIPRWTGNMVEDRFAFAHYELSTLHYRLNRADPEGMRHSLAELRKHLDEVEREFLPVAERLRAEREAKP